MDIMVYTKNLSPDLLPKIKRRFTDYSMDIEIHPEFKFRQGEDEGFLPIKLRVKKGVAPHYDSFGSEVLTGFELMIMDYDYKESLKEIGAELSKEEKKSFFAGLFGSKQNQTERYIVNKEIDEYLKSCDKLLILNIGSYNKSEFRIALFFAAILAEQTNGIFADPQAGRELTGSHALETVPLEVEDYENSIQQEDFHLEKFEEWL